MPLDIISRTVEFYEGGLSTLSERLRKNWLQKLDAVDTPDDSLTNLTWLYDMHPVGLELDGNQKSSEFNTGCTLKSSTCTQPFAGSLCDPQVRMDYRTKWTGKPPFSYATLICLAMRELGKPKVTLSDIYGWIMNNFAYYRHTDSSWQNSVRHNLSLNKCFEKVPRDKNERGKGGFWRVNPKHADWLEANLAKCKRVAPPPGPAPPVPRSMLLQQRQQMQGQFVQQNFLPGTAQQANLVGSVSQSEAYGTPPDFWSVGGHKSISPLSGSSSSLSSSPLSMSSAPSPANSAVYRQQPPIASHHLVPPADVNQIRPFPTSQERDSTYATPCISLFQQETIGPNQGSQSTHTHRRKSPLHRHTVLSEHEQLDPMYDELSFEVRTQSVFGNPEDQNILSGTQNSTASPPDGKRRNPNPMPHNVSPAADRKTWETKLRRVHCLEPDVQSAPTDVSRKQRSGSSLPTIEGYGGRGGHENFIGHLDNSQGKADKRLRLVRHQIKVKQFPTRTLPPRRRQSRWAITRDLCNETRDHLKAEKLTSDLTITHPKRPPYSNGYSNGAHIHLKASGSPSYLIPLVDEDDVGCSWPPITKSGSTVRVSGARNPQSDSSNSLPRLLPRGNTRVTPPYVPAGLSPRPRGLNKRDCPSSAASSSSAGSSLSGTSSTAHSDGHLYHSIPPQGHSTPKRVETQTCKQSFNNFHDDSADNSVHFSRLYPTSCEAEAHLGTSPDGLRMPKWASVFLSDGDEAELQPALWTQTESGQDTVDLFEHLETSDSEKVIHGISDSGNSTLHQPSPNESCFSYMSGLTDVLHPLDSGDSQYSNSEEQKNLESTLNSSPVTSSPILDAFNLDSSDLDFQTLNGLVEASGPIPLDLDFSLTASLNTPYSSASYESVSLSSALFSPQPWSNSGAVSSSETITSSWIGDSQLFSSSNCFLSILDGPEGFFNKTTVLQEDGENAPSDRLSTPPSR